ncbi:YrbL family protein [Salinicola sp. DM10]|uniref:YrbL family protein n=1 Tax=Salinicola sp. DM10 TaxID=2815721 RepID=UPI001E3AF19B|nr:YrbL family protein [Salinicola sp. DM10]MCE3026575.1 PhoP regulatory network YrbL family protein [Salinicola sp. DM10]
MVSLSLTPELAHGNDRAVYRHPAEAGRCIKVPRFPDRGSQQNEREKSYFEGLKRRGVRDWRYVPEYFGTVTTDLGEGLVFGLVTDADGSLSLNIRQFQQHGDADWLTTQAFVDELERLYHYLRDNWIVPSDINDRNVVCQRRADGSIRLWLIDGVSNPDFMPLANIWPWFARQKVDRRIRRFYQRLHEYGFIARAQRDALLASLP